MDRGLGPSPCLGADTVWRVWPIRPRSVARAPRPGARTTSPGRPEHPVPASCRPCRWCRGCSWCEQLAERFTRRSSNDVGQVGKPEPVIPVGITRRIVRGVSEDVTHGDRSAAEALPELGRIFRHGLVEVPGAAGILFSTSANPIPFAHRSFWSLTMAAETPGILSVWRRSSSCRFEPLDPLVHRRHLPTLLCGDPGAANNPPHSHDRAREAVTSRRVSVDASPW